MGYMKAGDAISGQEGSLIATINGKVYTVAELKNISAKVTKKKVEFKSIGHRGTQHKTTGWSGAGTMVIHYANSMWARMAIDYIKNGTDVYFDMLVTNEDPTSTLGKQTVKLMDCNMDEVELAKLDIDSEFLDQSMNFTFSDADMLDEFNPIP